MSLLTDKEIREALKPVGITPGNVLYEASRAIEQAVMTKLLEQNEPFAWACWSDGDTEQKPIDCYLSTDEPTAYPIRKKLFTHPAPSAPEGWQQFSHTLKYLIGTWRDSKGMFPQESDKYDESIAAARLLLKEADWQQGRYFPILAAARSE